MKRIKNETHDHAFTAVGDGKPASGKIVFVRGGSVAYLTVTTDRSGFASFSGASLLRALAHAILDEMPEPRKQKRYSRKSQVSGTENGSGSRR